METLSYFLRVRCFTVSREGQPPKGNGDSTSLWEDSWVHLGSREGQPPKGNGDLELILDTVDEYSSSPERANRRKAMETTAQMAAKACFGQGPERANRRKAMETEP